MDTLRFIIKRIFYLLILLLGVATIVFVLTRLVPTDPVAANLSQRNLNNEEMVNAFRAKWGLDKPVWQQYLIYLKGLLQLDFGTSIRTGKPVLSGLKRCFPATLELSIFAIIFASVVGILFGVISALKRNSVIDQIVRGVSVAGVSVPTFWLALLLLYLFYYKLGIAPGTGRISSYFKPPETVTGLYVIDALIEGNIYKAIDCLGHLVLPGIVLGSFTMGLITRTTRSNLLEVMSTDYIRTAKAKGMARVRLILHHAMGNALIPVLTVIGLGLGNLLGGTVLVETIFTWPGVGQFAYESVLKLDSPGIIGVAILIAFNYGVINTLIDILYGVIDPRVRSK
mgnify:CR=1 FL=1